MVAAPPSDGASLEQLVVEAPAVTRRAEIAHKLDHDLPVRTKRRPSWPPLPHGGAAFSQAIAP